MMGMDEENFSTVGGKRSEDQRSEIGGREGREESGCIPVNGHNLSEKLELIPVYKA
jgi:hypothetical protein